jgi:hypothetical protein
VSCADTVLATAIAATHANAAAKCRIRRIAMVFNFRAGWGILARADRLVRH